MANIDLYKNTTANMDAGKITKYPIEYNLTTNRPNTGYNRVLYCIYKIVDVGDKQFLQYLLYKYKNMNTLYLPFMVKKDLDKNFLKKTLDKENYSIMGYKIFEESLLTFVKVNNTNTELTLYNSDDIWLWVTIDEIVNIKSVYSYKIHASVTQIFYMNNDMCFLLDEKNNKILSPLISYKGGNENVLDFQLVYGFFRSSIWNTLGPFYNFKSFEQAIEISRGIKRQINEEKYKLKTDKLCLIRVAIFMGETKVFLNSDDDKESDYSDVQLKQLEDKTISQEEKNKIINYRRMNDFEGDWSVSYDSAQLGNVVEKNKVVYDGYTSISVKNTNNVVMLSYIKI
tara:strand:+ start:2307 stop:3329 length:1023 start_codon:yes stop_codon:yes gene_type:complete